MKTLTIFFTTVALFLASVVATAATPPVQTNVTCAATYKFDGRDIPFFTVSLYGDGSYQCLYIKKVGGGWDDVIRAPVVVGSRYIPFIKDNWTRGGGIGSEQCRDNKTPRECALILDTGKSKL